MSRWWHRGWFKMYLLRNLTSYLIIQDIHLNITQSFIRSENTTQQIPCNNTHLFHFFDFTIAFFKKLEDINHFCGTSGTSPCLLVVDASDLPAVWYLPTSCWPACSQASFPTCFFKQQWHSNSCRSVRQAGIQTNLAIWGPAYDRLSVFLSCLKRIFSSEYPLI